MLRALCASSCPSAAVSRRRSRRSVQPPLLCTRSPRCALAPYGCDVLDTTRSGIAHVLVRAATRAHCMGLAHTIACGCDHSFGSALPSKDRSAEVPHLLGKHVRSLTARVSKLWPAVPSVPASVRAESAAVCLCLYDRRHGSHGVPGISKRCPCARSAASRSLDTSNGPERRLSSPQSIPVLESFQQSPAKCGAISLTGKRRMPHLTACRLCA